MALFVFVLLWWNSDCAPVRKQLEHIQKDVQTIVSLLEGEKMLGPKHHDVATVLINLGSLYADLNRYAEAEQFYQRALAIDEKALGADHPTTQFVRRNLESLLAFQKLQSLIETKRATNAGPLMILIIGPTN